jgi:trk system potassium uptake protein TrkA
MKIIIVGGGKTGASLTASLTSEDHDVTVVDCNALRLNEICNQNDVMGINGDGMNLSSLLEAGLENADVLISSTGSDEQNLLCSLFAKGKSKCSTIARVRNPIYLKEINFIKEHLGLSLIINPELAAANEIARVIRLPSAIDVNPFAKGKVELLTFKITPDSLLNGKNLIYVRNKIENEVLFCSIERDGEFFIPSGNFELKAGDKASIITPLKKELSFFKKIGIGSRRIKNVLIAGGGTISYYLARQLIEAGIAVKIIEKDETRANELAEKLPSALIICGDPSDKNLLYEEGLSSVGAFVTLTGIDEENVLLSLYAKDVTDAKVITKIDRNSFNELIGKLDLDTVIYPCNITTELILQYVRTKQNAMGNNVENLYKLVEDKVEALEFKIGENAPIVDIPLQKMELKDNLIICGIIHRGKFIIPNGESTVSVGDRIIVVTSQKKLNDVGDILK